MKKITLQKLENKIVEDKTVENLNRLAQNMESLNNNATIDNTTKIHCLEQKLGEYHGFFKVLVLLNQDKAVKLSVKHRDILAKATDFNAKIYHLGEQQ